MNAVDLRDKLSTFSERWAPRVVATFNGNDIMVAKAEGEFTWHNHPDTDDFFLVLKGSLKIKLRNGDVELKAGQLYVVPKGVDHCPVANGEVEMLIIEPRGTPNTGDMATAVPRRVI